MSSKCDSTMNDKDDQEDERTVLASIYDDDTFMLDQEGEDMGGQFIACFSLPRPFFISTATRKIQDLDSCTASAECSSELPQDTLEVMYLPPVTLNFRLPSDYPSTQSPQFTLSCKWLTIQQLSSLCKRLDELWHENAGCVILFLWTNFLQNEAFDYLKLSSPLDLSNIVSQRRKASNCDSPTADSATLPSTSDPRAIQDIASQTLLLAAVRDSDQQQRLREFHRSVFPCKVCFCDKLGSQCIQFPQCLHVYCSDCMKDFFAIQIGEGKVNALKCPEEECESEAHLWQVKKLVSDKLFVRYDELLLKNSLETMTDVTYCPRPVCRSPVIVDRENNMGGCTACKYVFCVLCTRVYHGPTPCRVKSDQLKKLREEYLTASDEGRIILEKRYGKRVIERTIQETWSSDWLERHAKQCPSCGTQIQKIDGCNKMTCTKCHTFFCWLCSARLSRANPYSHYSMDSGECFNRLFEGIDDLHEEEEEEEDAGDAEDLYWRETINLFLV